MKLELGYLYSRHEFWKNEIGAKGIWDKEAFLPVTIEIRPKRRSCHGLFQRRKIIKNGVAYFSDKIKIYQNTEEFLPEYLDSILVHEMIHQYIFQTGLKDTRAHGRIFRSFMQRINREFPDWLTIEITGSNPLSPREGAGQTVHELLLLRCGNDYFCCVLHPSRVESIERKVKYSRSSWNISEAYRATSDNVYFENFRRCMTSLHGKKMTAEEFYPFIDRYSVKINSEPVKKNKNFFRRFR